MKRTVFNTNISNDRGDYKVLTENTFMQRFLNHLQTIRCKRYEHGTELPSHVWKLKGEGKYHDRQLPVHMEAPAFAYV